jgi:hypothetical protein
LGARANSALAVRKFCKLRRKLAVVRCGMAPSHLMAPRQPYSSYGRCVYCAQTFPKLTKEHIIPEGLSGSWYITGACCECAKRSNEEYENLVLQSDMVRTMRAFLTLKRKKKKRPITMPPMFAYGTASLTTIDETDFLPASSNDFYPRLFAMLALEPPIRLARADAVLDQRPFRLWIRDVANRTPGPAVLTDPAIVANAYTSSTDLMLSADLTADGKSLSIRQKFPMLKFMRMLAKIAYCFAVAERGIDRYKDSELRQLVQGGRDDYHTFVGGTLNGDYLTDRYLHHLAFRERDNWATVIVHLFSSYHAPAYEVVIGPAS